ncbi:EI24 domain-containing protein [Streptomyces somaliensis DSM 40738]|uniref:EI24 domain-containing protein n=1 Tax=Streptomyces somaliensis (strain ATCC 33201 / DSM 40738 / JCM 12659 / KCTC 9044 / NCTC 11332 / NRRL B-12077 / IP 733) TaxID=1134445 RepID=A0AA44DBT4_STRE0|nr:EI24 domain-containing protein [Streptomyces somaliensis]MCQ0022595.1 EI24 domain-containing protein [Streptomyces somaliensis DSM 40738]NKY13485.1 EI24 domain-containing protein [Streptomyces somaliensis DSM 40738]
MRDLGKGFGFLLQGQRWVGRHGRWFGFGLLPGLVTLVLYAAALVGLLYGAGDLTGWATPFADGWSSHWRNLFRGFLTALLFVLALFLAVVTFTAVTLLVGQPFYESLSEAVDRSEGGRVPESGLPFWRGLWISARDSLRVVLRVASYGVLLFALGFVPVIGQTVVPVLGFCVSGYFLTEELTAVALQRRRLGLKERLRLLRGHRMMALGFGVPLTLAYLVPFVAVFLMPGAVAGATLMARELAPDAEDGPHPGPAAGPGTSTPAPPGLHKD